jgi:SAM-dependent methyltransferase
MTISRLTSALCIATLAVVACERQQPAQSAPGSSAATRLAPEPGMRPASAENAPNQPRRLDDTPANHASAPAAPTPPPAPNSLGIPAAPPQAQQGPTAQADGTLLPERTPDVVYVPTPQPVVDRMLQMAKVKKDDVVYDLGCGDGRIVVTAAKRYGVRAFGFDIDPQRVAEAKANVKAANVEDLVTIEQKDIFTLDLSPASVVTLYLLPKLNVRLIPQLEQLKPGSRIVSHDFNMEGIKPLQHVTLRPVGESENHAIYLWKTPLVRE